MIAIVGAGLTGLALAHELARRGIPHLVLEASQRVGGVIRSGRVDGHLLEWGPQRARLTRPLARLIDELDLPDQVVTAPPGLPLWIFRHGRLRQVPFGPAEFVRTDLLSRRGKLRLLLEPLHGAARGEESVAHFFTRKMGREAYEALLGPLYGGLYASDPADMVVGLSLAQVLREFGVGRSLLLRLLRAGGGIQPPPASSFHEGLETLPRALHRANQANVRLGARVRTLRRTGAGWSLEVGDGVVDARAVVLTVPAPAAASLLADAAPAVAQRLARLRYNPLGVVHLRSESRLVGLGYQVAFGEPLATRGVTFNDALFDRRGVYTAYLGGAKQPAVVDLPDAELGALAVSEFRTATGAEGTVLAVEREAMPAWDKSWSALAGIDLPEGLHLAANWESRPGMPGRLAQAARLAERLAGAGNRG